MIDTLHDIQHVSPALPFSKYINADFSNEDKEEVLLIVLIITLPISFASQSLTYDANGNLVTGDGYYREYNDFNQMNKIRNGENASAPLMEEYFYDHEGIRKATLKYNSTGYNYEKTYTPFREYMQIENNSGTYNFTYVYQGDVLVARKNPDGSKYYYHPDSLGSTSLITDNSGAVVEKTFYSAYGELQSNPSAEKRVGYTGHELDEDTGQVYMKARFYKPSQGQFVQPDTLLPNVYDPQQLNRYMYVRGNSYKYKDESGHLPIIPVIIGVAAAIGAVANVINYYATHETTSISGALAYAGAGAIAGAGAAVGAISGIGVAVAATAAVATGVAGKIIEDLSDGVSIKGDIAGIISAGALNYGGSVIGAKVFPTSYLHKNIASMRAYLSLLTTKSGREFIRNGIFDESLSATISGFSAISGGWMQRSYASAHETQSYQEAVRQQIISQAKSDSYSGGSGYNPDAGAYVTPDGHVYPTTNPDWRPCGCATNV